MTHRKNGASGSISVRNLRAFSFMNVTLRVAMLYPPGREFVQSAAPAQHSSRRSPYVKL